jgi:hypothetical protein
VKADPCASAALVAVDANRMGPRWKWWRKGWLRRRGLREVCWFCHADYAGSPCPTCGWSPVRQTVFVDFDGKRYTNEVMASDGDHWLNATITMPGMGRQVALPLRISSPWRPVEARNGT